MRLLLHADGATKSGVHENARRAKAYRVRWHAISGLKVRGSGERMVVSLVRAGNGCAKFDGRLRVPLVRARNGCAKFDGRLRVFGSSCRKTSTPIKFFIWYIGFFFFLGGGGVTILFYGRGDCWSRDETQRRLMSSSLDNKQQQLRLPFSDLGRWGSALGEGLLGKVRINLRMEMVSQPNGSGLSWHYSSFLPPPQKNDNSFQIRPNW